MGGPPKPSVAAARAVARHGGVLAESIACHRCGAAFKPFSVVSRWCSKLCRNRQRDANRARRWKIKRQAIYDRDGGICQLCNQPVDQSLPRQHIKAFTLDHIVPVSAGGNDDESNLQTAHMDCNSVKGGVVRWTARLPLPAGVAVS